MATSKKRKGKKKQSQRPPLQLHKALDHELRVEILTYLSEHSSGSPSRMGEALGAETKAVSYHAQQLVRYGAAELAELRPTKKGSPEHVYRAIKRPLITTEEMEKMAKPARHGFAGQIIQKVIDDATEGLTGGAFADEADWHMTRELKTLDVEGWQEMLAIYKRALEEASGVQAKSDTRRIDSGEEGLRVSSSLLCFVMPKQSRGLD